VLKQKSILANRPAFLWRVAIFNLVSNQIAWRRQTISNWNKTLPHARALAFQRLVQQFLDISLVGHAFYLRQLPRYRNVGSIQAYGDRSRDGPKKPIPNPILFVSQFWYVAQVNLVIGHRGEAPQIFPFRLSEFPFSGLLERNSLSSRLLHKASFPAASLSGQK